MPSPDTERGRFESDLEGRLDAVYRGRRWLVGATIDQAAARVAGELHRRFDADVLAVGARRGTGPVDDTVPLVSLDLPPAGDLMAGMRSAERALVTPGPEAMARVDSWDPDGRAGAIGDPTFGESRLADRPVLGARPPAWSDLEDKLAIEAIWAAAGVPTAPSAQIDVGDPPALLAAHRRLATELGTVWAVDNAQGWHGGAEGTIWVPDRAAAMVVSEGDRLASHRRVRITPFVEGVPCSIHGLVMPRVAEPAVFRPCEMMVLRDRSAHRFVYARASTFWDPAAADREAMRDAARRIGGELMGRVGYRGFYTVDGILGADGFVPTEVNTRFGAALPSRIPTLAGGEVNLLLVNQAVIEGGLELDPAAFERWLVSVMDREREARAVVATGSPPDRPVTGSLVVEAGGTLMLREARPDGGGDEPGGGGEDEGGRVVAEVEWGPGVTGGVLFVTGVDLPVGLPTAPMMVELLRAVGRAWPVELPELEAAAAVR